MSGITRTIRSLLLWTALGGIGGIATDAALIAHIKANLTTTCHHDGCSDHRDETREKSHDKEHCAICQILLGPAGKYMADMPITTLIVIRQMPPEEIAPPQIFQQHALGTAKPRGPPCC